MIDRIYRSSFIFFIIIIDQLYSYLCVCLGIESIALTKQLILQFLIILNDSVVYSYNISVITDMWMCIILRRLSMSRPAGMTNTTGAWNRFSVVCLLSKSFQTTFCLDNPGLLPPIAHCDSGRVIATIFKLGKSIQQDRCCLMITCKSYDSTHKYISSYSFNAY